MSKKNSLLLLSLFFFFSCQQEDNRQNNNTLIKEALSWAPSSLDQPTSVTVWQNLQKIENKIEQNVLDFSLTNRIMGIVQYNNNNAQEAADFLGINQNDLVWELNIGKGTAVVKLKENINFAIDSNLFVSSGYQKGNIKNGSFFYIDKKQIKQIEQKTLRHAYIESIVWLRDKNILMIGPIYILKYLIEDSTKNMLQEFDLEQLLTSLDNPPIMSFYKPRWRFQNFFYLLDKTDKASSSNLHNLQARLEHKRLVLKEATTVDSDRLSELNEYMTLCFASYPNKKETQIIMHYDNEEKAAKDYEARVKIEQKGHSLQSKKIINDLYPLKRTELQGKNIILVSSTPKGIKKRLVARDFLSVMNL